MKTFISISLLTVLTTISSASFAFPSSSVCSDCPNGTSCEKQANGHYGCRPN